MFHFIEATNRFRYNRKLATILVRITSFGLVIVIAPIFISLNTKSFPYCTVLIWNAADPSLHITNFSSHYVAYESKFDLLWTNLKCALFLAGFESDVLPFMPPTVRNAIQGALVFGFSDLNKRLPFTMVFT